MKQPSMCFLFFFASLLAPLSSMVQPPTVTPTTTTNAADSLALLSIYAELNPEAQQRLQWDGANPVSSWTGVALNTEGRVVGLNLSGKNIKWEFPRPIIELDALNRFSCADNAITALPPLPPSIKELLVNDNRLRELPQQSFFNLSAVDCRNNRLTFEALGRFLDTSDYGLEKFYYIPQQRLGDGYSYRTLGQGAVLDLYPLGADSVLLSGNQYAWKKNGQLIANTKDLILNNLAFQDSGTYTLKVTNLPNGQGFPGLTLEGAIRLLVLPPGALIIDNTTVMVQAPSGDFAAIDTLMEKLGLAVDKKCWCADDGEARLKLYRGDDAARVLVEPNSAGSGSKSKIDTDTMEYNYLLVHNPLDVSISSGLGCGFDPVTTPDHHRTTVALIDSGSDTDHPSLQGFFAINENLGSDEDCYPGDVFGWNFIDDSPDIKDADGHGTAGMDVIKSRLPGGTSLAVMNLKVFHNDKEQGVLFDLVCAIHYAVDKGVDIINISMGYYGPEPSVILHQALQRAEQAGILVVLSAGNDGHDNAELPVNEYERWPGRYKFPGLADLPPLANLLSVGAYDSASDSIASFSNRGSQVDVLAPGTGIRAAAPGGQYGHFNGTSIAATLATRLAAIYKSKEPDNNYQDIVTFLKSNTVHLAYDGGVAWGGKLDESRALASLGIQIKPNATHRPEPIHISPTPFFDEVFIKLGDGNTIFENVTFRVTETRRGKKVFEETCNTNIIRWDGRDNNGLEVPEGKHYFFHILVPDTRAHIIKVEKRKRKVEKRKR